MTSEVHSYLLSGPHWLALMRIGLGLWWLESFRHKDKRAWLQRGAGIAWAASVAEKHRSAFVRRTFQRQVAPHPFAMSLVVLGAELAVGLGLALGFLTPVAAAGAVLLNVQYFVLMIHDWAEQGQNAMMALLALAVIFLQAWQAWSIDGAIGLF